MLDCGLHVVDLFQNVYITLLYHSFCVAYVHLCDFEPTRRAAKSTTVAIVSGTLQRHCDTACAFLALPDLDSVVDLVKAR